MRCFRGLSFCGGKVGRVGQFCSYGSAGLSRGRWRYHLPPEAGPLLPFAYKLDAWFCRLKYPFWTAHYQIGIRESRRADANSVNPAASAGPVSRIACDKGFSTAIASVPELSSPKAVSGAASGLPTTRPKPNFQPSMVRGVAVDLPKRDRLTLFKRSGRFQSAERAKPTSSSRIFKIHKSSFCLPCGHGRL